MAHRLGGWPAPAATALSLALAVTATACSGGANDLPGESAGDTGSQAQQGANEAGGVAEQVGGVAGQPTVALRGAAAGGAGTGAAYGSADGEMGIHAEFFGQDGASHAGLGCSPDGKPDNIHIRLSALPSDKPLAGFEVEDYTGGGLWVDPCNDVNWFLVPLPTAAGVVDLYMKPHRDAPADAPYRVTVRFEDGDSAVVELLGDRVFTDVAAGPSAEGSIELEFLGQDGKGLAGEACAEGDAADNIHIRVSGLSGEREVAGFQVDDYVGGGRWVYPCNDENWLVVPRLPEPGMADLYLKPHRDAPDDTEYIVTVYYGDGTHHRAVILGSAVTLEAE